MTDSPTISNPGRRKWFYKFHCKLSKQTGIDPESIALIRDMMIGRRMSLEQTIVYTKGQVEHLYKSSVKGKRFQKWQRVLAFLLSLTTPALESILVLSPADRNYVKPTE